MHCLIYPPTPMAGGHHQETRVNTAWENGWGPSQVLRLLFLQACWGRMGQWAFQRFWKATYRDGCEPTHRGNSVHNLLMAPQREATGSNWGPVCGFPEVSFFLQLKRSLISLALKSIPCSIYKGPGTMTVYFSFFLSYTLGFPLILTIFLKISS